jgi:hypothetical protein
VINDEITQDFEKACQIAANDFKLRWIELRSMWDKNITDLSPKQIDDAGKILQNYKLQVTDIASPLFKTDWQGAPRSRRARRVTSFMPTSMPMRKTNSLSTAFRWPRHFAQTESAVSTTGGSMIPSPIALPSMPNCSKLPSGAQRQPDPRP